MIKKRKSQTDQETIQKVLKEEENSLNPFEVGSESENEDPEPEIISMQLQENKIEIDPEMSVINNKGKLFLVGFKILENIPKILNILKTHFNIEAVQTTTNAKWRIFIQAGTNKPDDLSQDLKEFLSRTMKVIHSNQGLTYLTLNPIFKIPNMLTYSLKTNP